MSDYMLVDADNHYYEAEDAFTRHGDEGVKRYVRWVQDGKRKHLMFGSNLSDTPPNPTFNPIAKAGAFHQRLKDLEAGKRNDRNGEFSNSWFGELVPLPDEYRHKDARLAVLDEQNLEKCFLFPTLGDCVEGLMHDDPVMGHKAYHAFNLWLEDDWGYHYRDRLYAPPYIPVLDPELAADELEFVLNKGARIVSVRPGPAAGRSPADPVFDRFWSLANEAEILVAYHAYGGRTVYGDAFDLLYERDKPVSDRRYYATIEAAFTSDRGILETTMALVLGNLFGRFPKVRVASIEMGMNWVPYVLHALDHAGGLLDRNVNAFGQKVDERPSEIFKRHVWVSPFPEEDVVALTESIGVSQVLFGSDWPHAEGNIMPADYTECIQNLPEADIKRIMRDNALALLSPA
jgi:predicted TIM-barrel fold metal-dependent hydrolase